MNEIKNLFQNHRAKNIVIRKVVYYDDRMEVLRKEPDPNIHHLYYDAFGGYNRRLMATAIRMARTQINTYGIYGEECLKPGYVFRDHFWRVYDDETSEYLPWLTFEMEKINE